MIDRARRSIAFGVARIYLAGVDGVAEVPDDDVPDVPDVPEVLGVRPSCMADGLDEVGADDAPEELIPDDDRDELPPMLLQAASAQTHASSSIRFFMKRSLK